MPQQTQFQGRDLTANMQQNINVVQQKEAKICIFTQVRQNKKSIKCILKYSLWLLAFVIALSVMYLVMKQKSADKLKNAIRILSEHSDTCGKHPLLPQTAERKISARIISGRQTHVMETPWQASLWHETLPVCGGSIILISWIITAAHCVQHSAKPDTIYVGLTNLSDVNDPLVQKFTILKDIVHPKYQDDKTYDYDIALLQLAGKIKFSSHVSPLCIPRPNLPPKETQLYYLSGYGDVNYLSEIYFDYNNNETYSYGNGGENTMLHTAKVRLFPKDKCKEVMNGQLTDRMICAGSLDEDVDACEGDSGGPLAHYSPDTLKWTLTGIISWGMGCGYLPGVYTDVSYFSYWIWAEIAKYDR